jgi:hypothetical protein
MTSHAHEFLTKNYWCKKINSIQNKAVSWKKIRNKDQTQRYVKAKWLCMSLSKTILQDGWKDLQAANVGCSEK